MDRPEQRPRSKSTFSFKSDKSHGSRGKSLDKSSHSRSFSHSSHESPEQKLRSHLSPTGKADPNAAMNEVQPMAAALEKPTLQSLRAFNHTDRDGNPIAEPDLSNPTRSRWERPLDTIRSFEAAIDNEYKRRSQAMRPDSGIHSGFASRRSSYYGGSSYDQNRYSQYSNNYGNRQVRDSYGEGGGYGYGGPVGGRGSRYNPNRMQSDPGWTNRQSVGSNMYPAQAHMQSRDTVNTGGSGSQSDPNSNEPGSENSSIEQRGGPVMQPNVGEQYGFNGFGAGPQPILEEYASQPGPNDGYFPPPVSTKLDSAPSNAFSASPIQLSSSNAQAPPPPPATAKAGLLRKNTNTEGKEKKTSWLKKRFSSSSKN